MKLGKLEPRDDPRTLRLAAYLTDRPAPPKLVKITGRRSWPMLGNDQIGDCALAALAHQEQAWAGANHRRATFGDQEVENAYFGLTGGQDTGLVELDVLRWWRKEGLGGHKIEAFAAVQLDHVRDAVFLFGGLYIGLSLPTSAQGQVGRLWAPVDGATGAPGSWGGHAVNIIGYSPQRLWCVTWGKIQALTWDFYDRYCDEAWACLSPAWLSKAGLSPQGLDLRALRADLAQVASPTN